MEEDGLYMVTIHIPYEGIQKWRVCKGRRVAMKRLRKWAGEYLGPGWKVERREPEWGVGLTDCYGESVCMSRVSVERR